MRDGGDLPMADRIRANARLVVRTARERMRTEIWYDRAGVEWLDRYLDTLKGAAEPTRPALVATLGAFLGECVVRSFGGEWAGREDTWGVRFDEKNWAFPFAKVAKQIENGREDSVLAFFDAIPLVFKRMPPAPSDEDPS